MYYLHLNNSGLLERVNLREKLREYPRVSFPEQPQAETLRDYGIFPCEDATLPDKGLNQRVDRDEQPTAQGDGTYVWGWTVRDKTQAELNAELNRWRDKALLYRRDFCIALKRAGILPTQEALAAAKGDWPATFAGALSGLTQDEQDEAQIEWAAVIEIRRNHPMIELLRVAAGMTPEQVDALFGWTR